MRTGVLWMVMAMVCLSDVKVPSCLVRKISTVSRLSKVSVSCPSVPADSLDVKFLLNFNDSCINQVHVNKADSGESLFSGRFEVTANNSGVYICMREVIYPPPFRDVCHATQVIVAEKQSGPAVNDTVAEPSQGCALTSPVIPEVVMWVACGALLFYSLSITCVAVVKWRKRSTDVDDTVVYANTKQGEFRKPYKV